MITLHNVYGADEMNNISLLYDLLAEREPSQSISHKRMPRFIEHLMFVESRPYEAWYIIRSEFGAKVGAIYLSKQREIGVGILMDHRGLGYAEEAIEVLMRMHPGRFLANINPQNQPSLSLFKKLGFTGPIQVTLEKEAA